MKNYKEPIDKSAPYRTTGFGPIKAPAKTETGLKSRTVRSGSDLRVKGGK